VTLSLVPSYCALCLVQGALVLAAPGPRRLKSFSSVAAAPVIALAVGVLLVRELNGAAFLADLATVAAPILTAMAPWLLGRPRPWVGLPFAAALYLLAWVGPGMLLREAAGVTLIAGACLALAALLSALAPARALIPGLLALVLLDAVLVWGTPQIGPTTEVLHAAQPPAVSVAGAPAKTLPSLQDATFGSAIMGWLDLLAPALLGFVADESTRRPAAVATTLVALVWGLLLTVTSPIPATVPVVAGILVVARRPVAEWWARRHRAAAASVGYSDVLP
jgi:hypothetical protein